MMSLTSVRELAAVSIQKAQCQYKKQYENRARERPLLPQDENGRMQKLS